MSAPSRRPEIRRRRARKKKLDKLRSLYVSSKSESDKNRIIAKARKMNPAFNLNEFLKPIAK
jgi:hypothetical protein